MVIDHVLFAGVIIADYFHVWTAALWYKTPIFYRVFTVLWYC